jgi:Ni/Co efflux regulator RcnB
MRELTHRMGVVPSLTPQELASRDDPGEFRTIYLCLCLRVCIQKESEMRTLISYAVALTLLSSVAVGQRYDNDNRAPSQQDQNYKQDQQYGDRDNRDRGEHRDRDSHRWARGERLPREFLSRQYMVVDWNENRLRRPPRNYEWIRIDDQFLLTKTSDGAIAEIVDRDRERH